jgi:excisionase family DNA binding protein
MKVRLAAEALGCDPSTVRALLRSGELHGHRVGRGARPRGVRVFSDSVIAYQDRHLIKVRTAPNPQPRRVSRSLSLPHRLALERLRVLGAA